MKTFVSILIAAHSLTACVNREPFPDGMSMEEWMTMHHIPFKQTFP